MLELADERGGVAEFLDRRVHSVPSRNPTNLTKLTLHAGRECSPMFPVTARGRSRPKDVPTHRERKRGTVGCVGILLLRPIPSPDGGGYRAGGTAVLATLNENLTHEQRRLALDERRRRIPILEAPKVRCGIECT
jgi:hypothetical protein